MKRFLISLAIPVIIVLSAVMGYSAVNVFSVSATSSAPGFPASALMDNDPATGWKPVGEAGQLLEGMTVSFTEPSDIHSLEIVQAGNPKTPAPSFYIYADGKFAGGITANKKITEMGLKAVTELEFYTVSAPDETVIGEIRINSSGDSNKNIVLPTVMAGKIVVNGISANPGIPWKLSDGDITSAWTYGYSSPSAAPAINFEFSSNILFSSLYIANGVQSAVSVFQSGGKVKSFELRADGILLGVYTLKDIPGIQKVNIGKPAHGKNIELKVIAVYGNDLLKNAALSEVAFGSDGKIIRLSAPDAPKAKGAPTVKLPGFVSKCMKFQYISLSNINETYLVKFRPDGTFAILSETYGFHFTKNNFIKGVWNTLKSAPSVWEIGLNGTIYKYSEKFDSAGFSENVSVECTTGNVSESLKISLPSPNKALTPPPVKAMVTNTVYVTNIIAYSKTNVIIYKNQHMHPLKKTNLQIVKITGTNLTEVPVICEKDGNALSPWCYMVRDITETNLIAPAAYSPDDLVNWYLKNNGGQCWKIESGLIWGIYPAVISELDYLETYELGEPLDMEFLAPKGK
ncbi:MAG: hypothetical protein HPY53_09845 [Brevinematales bacterium]|nr:hypothetical protein [Brevinematales bacterium]